MMRPGKYALLARPDPRAKRHGPARTVLPLQKTLILGTSLLLAFVAALWWTQRQSARVDRLLSRAYTERRTMERRNPGVAYAPFLSIRGDNSHVATSPSLLDAEVKIQDALKTHPRDPLWLQYDA